MIKLADNWIDYKVLATGDGNKLEKWGEVYLLRPDPQVIWHSSFELQKHPELHAIYRRSKMGGGNWDYIKKTKEEWTIDYQLHDKKMTLLAKPMGFKHTGIFPEQAANWDSVYTLIKNRCLTGVGVNVLNLFGYTGAASVACSLAGAKVTHVDAAKNMVERCKQNANLNKIDNIRYIVDDCSKFVEREVKRKSFYDAIIMDPPSFGRGPNNEEWKIEDHICNLVKNTAKLLSDNALFFLINSYTTGLQPAVLSNIANIYLPKCSVQSYEVALPTEQQGIVLPCGCSVLAKFCFGKI